MNWLKKVTTYMLTLSIFLPCIAQDAFAANSSSVGFSGTREIVRIDILSNGEQTDDFLTRQPKRLSLKEETLEFPVAQWEVYDKWDRSQIPMYFQENYPDALYGTGTVETCGGGITALAMVATYLTGYDYLPDELARWFAGKGSEDVARLTYGSEALGLPYETSEEWSDVVSAVKAGKPVILHLDRLSVFTGSEQTHAQHFVILTGLTAEGKYLVQDPKGANYVAETLQEGFLNGFDEETVSTGFRYAWIYNKAQVPSDLAHYTYTAEPEKTSRYAKLKLTATQIQLLARVVAVCGAGECDEGRQAMAEVLLNRLLSSEYPDALTELIFGEEPMCDTSQLNAAELTGDLYRTVDRAINGPYLLEKTVTDFSYTCHK